MTIYVYGYHIQCLSAITDSYSLMYISFGVYELLTLQIHVPSRGHYYCLAWLT